MQRIALAAGPSAASPDDVVTGHLLGDVRHRLVVAQREEVMLIETRTAILPNTVVGGGFAEIHLDGAHAELEQIGQLGLVP